MTEQNAARVSLRTAAILTLFTLVFTTLMAATYKATKPAIDASAEAEKLKLVGEVLPATLYDNTLLADYVDIPPRAELGLAAQDDPVRLLRARRAGAPAALVFEAVAPDGYGGRIRLILAVGADNRLIGVERHHFDLPVPQHRQQSRGAGFVARRLLQHLRQRDRRERPVLFRRRRPEADARWLPGAE